jgi:alkylation response protein AidB-like acyl-CoA dehydrogenase
MQYIYNHVGAPMGQEMVSTWEQTGISDQVEVERYWQSHGGGHIYAITWGIQLLTITWGADKY